MKAIIKSIDLNDAVGFDQYWPENEECFGVWLTVQIGPDDQEGGTYFRYLYALLNGLKANIFLRVLYGEGIC